MSVDVAIVGAGLAGLGCARRLQEIGKSFVLLEASDAVGGRVRTDVVDGFRLDRGFQVLLTAYPECQKLANYDALALKEFVRGALIRHEGKFHRFVDPRRAFVAGLGTIVGPIGTAVDKWKLFELESSLKKGRVEDLFEQPEGLTLDFLRQYGFSDRMIDRFFKPFFGGIFLEKDLVTSSRMFRFLFRMFAEGPAAVPASGMHELPKQIASNLPADAARLNTTVAEVSPGRVTLTTGEVVTAKAIVIATEAAVAAKLLGRPSPKPGRAVSCFYFAADRSPVNEPIVVLDADESGPVHNLAVMSDVSASYAPPGNALISATVLGDAGTEETVREQLTGWYGAIVATWRHLKTYRIPYALPDQTAPALDEPERSVLVAPGLFVCGDHVDNASINGALHSGWRAAQAAAE